MPVLVMMISVPPIEELLRRAGFVTKGRNRAQCPDCSGGSNSTVGFNAEQFHCFRCGAKGSRKGLAKKLGLLAPGNLTREERAAMALENRNAAMRSALRAQFTAWPTGQEAAALDRLQDLRTKARLARKIPQAFPDCEPAWEALARLAHGEADLYAELDFLQCVQASHYLEKDSQLADVVARWRQDQ